MKQFTDAVGGVPFVNDEFNPQLLLSVVAARRRQYDGASMANLESYLHPRLACRICHKVAVNHIEEPTSTPLEPAFLAQAKASLEQVCTLLPQWSTLFSIPIVYKRLASDQISLTNAHFPQIIYLGGPAFVSPDTLSEVLVHEFAHVWLNMLAETSDLQVAGASQSFTLPSGTGGKSVRGVILASHFAVAAHAFHAALNIYPDRRDYLARYGAQCNRLLDGSPEVSEMGAFVVRQLDDYLDRNASEATSLPGGRCASQPGVQG